MKKLAAIEAVIILFLILIIVWKKPAPASPAPTPASVIYDPEHDVVAVRNKAFFDAQVARIKAEQDCNGKLLDQWMSEHQKRKP